MATAVEDGAAGVIACAREISVQPDAGILDYFPPLSDFGPDQRSELLGPHFACHIHPDGGEPLLDLRLRDDFRNFVRDLRDDSLRRSGRGHDSLPVTDLKTRKAELDHGRNVWKRG